RSRAGPCPLPAVPRPAARPRRPEGGSTHLGQHRLRPPSPLPSRAGHRLLPAIRGPEGGTRRRGVRPRLAPGTCSAAIWRKVEQVAADGPSDGRCATRSRLSAGPTGTDWTTFALCETWGRCHGAGPSLVMASLGDSRVE